MSSGSGFVTLRKMATLLLVLALALGAVALVGCGGTKESPGGPKGTGVSEEASATAVPAAAQTQVLDAMKAAGYAISDPVYVQLTYGDNPNQVVVQGSFRGPKGEALTKAVLTNAGGKWAVTSVK